MSYKPKKLNKQKTKKDKDPNKFHFGWNTGTYLIIIGGIVGLVLIYLIFHFTLISSDSYYRAYHDNFITPFTDKEDTEEENKKYTAYEGYTLVEAKDFDKLNVDFYCKSFDSKDAKKAEFKVALQTNENTGSLGLIDANFNIPKNSSGSYKVYARICLANNWINYEQYSSAIGYDESSLNNNNVKTINVILSDLEFPAKTKTWPVPIEVSWPDAYLFIIYYNQGKTTPEKYVIHYTPEDFIVKQKTESREITSPVH